MPHDFSTSLARPLRTAIRLGFAGSLACLLVAAASVPSQAAAPRSADPADAAAPPLTSLQFEHGPAAAPTRLRGRDARLQLIVTGTTAAGRLLDRTRDVAYRVTPSGRVQIDANGLVTPLQNGAVRVHASDSAGQQASVELVVEDFDANAPISFPSQVVPVFTKLGCNGGGCHGKAAGQNGFKLSLLGFGPEEDYEHLVTESRGRRIFPAAPGQSLLLLKAINASPHGGGQRMDVDSFEYRLLRRWIEQGLPYGTGEEPQLVSIDAFPKQRQLQPQAAQQLSVIATYSDGSQEDITRAAVYEPNDPSMATVAPSGLVTIKDLVGDVAVMARYQGHVTVFLADIPQETPAERWHPETWPAPHNLVDQAVFDKLRSLRIPPSGPCDDATFLRRLTLDLTGRLPTLEEISEYEAIPADRRRSAWIERLLATDDYAEYFANKWSAILRNQREGGPLQFANLAFYQWIRDSLRENTPYDVFVRELMTASGSVASNPAVAWYDQVPDTNQRIEDAAQLFLGQRIQCARCHHHPYEKWSQGDYTQMAAFFSLVAKKSAGNPNEPRFVANLGKARAKHPKTGASLPPAGLDSEPAQIALRQDPRVPLADWMVQKDNPFFAKSLVNRYWKHFLGRGLVEPEDDLRVTNPPSNPELLAGMAEAFAASDYDLKFLIRLICQSQAYQRSSQPLPDNLGDRRCYSRFYPKRLPAEVLLDAVDRMTETTTSFAGMPAGTRAVALPDTGFDSYFLTAFGRPNASTACECERSQEATLAQSLHLLNSEQMQTKLSSERGRAARLAAAEQLSPADRVRELYRVAFCRQPSDGELKSTLGYLSERGHRREAYEDLIWSLVNSKEFLFNH